jgi:hypothetical protein
MKPSTLHAVVTFEASICHGGHLYPMSTMRNTMYGIMHTFVGSSVLTNTEHTTDSRMLLRRDYHGCIQMHPGKYPWMVDKFLWIWMISMDYPHHPQN